MLKKEPSDRPNINKIMKYPLIEERAKIFLGDERFEDEYSKTNLGTI
jgi:hypothetical protein